MCGSAKLIGSPSSRPKGQGSKPATRGLGIAGLPKEIGGKLLKQPGILMRAQFTERSDRKLYARIKPLTF